MRNERNPSPTTPSSSPQRSQGFTIVEILIALAIFGVVIAQAFAVFGAQHVTYTNTERAIEVQEDARLIADAVLSDVRMAGYMVPPQAGIASVDGGNANPDLLCVSDPEKLADVEVAKQSARFDRVDPTGPVGNSADQVSISDPDYDGDGDHDFAVGDGIILVDGTSSHCAVITAVGGASFDILSFTPRTPPAGFSVGSASGRVVPAIAYRLQGSELFRNGRRLSNQVEDLQIEFGIDADSDGQLIASEYVHDLNGSDPRDLLAVRLTVIARADREDESIESSGRPAAANRAAGAADGFRRRRVTASILPRNLL